MNSNCKISNLNQIFVFTGTGVLAAETTWFGLVCGNAAIMGGNDEDENTRCRRIPPVPFEDTLIQYGTNTVVYMYSEYYAYSDSVLYNLVLAHHVVHDVNDDCEKLKTETTQPETEHNRDTFNSVQL